MHDRARIRASGSVAGEWVSLRLGTNAWQRAGKWTGRRISDYGIYSTRDGAIVAVCTNFKSCDTDDSGQSADCRWFASEADNTK